MNDKITIDCEDFRNDKSPNSTYYAWQANIAMAFKDEYQRFIDISGNDDCLRNESLHDIANNAAKNFLDNLCRKNENAPVE